MKGKQIMPSVKKILKALPASLNLNSLLKKNFEMKSKKLPKT